jgi:hypothetical protein
MKNKVERQEEAQARKEAHDKRTVDEQLALIDQRPGKSEKEAMKIIARGRVA